ncbi:MAG: quinolinate synthase NadA [Lachnospiraceae bacterium]|jgi:quinolinate synthase|nr:quinolinate synthase NadA [Lachnospiraceae bacterium]
MEDKRKRVQELKKEKDAVLMAHYYVEQEVQEVADYIGDSYYLAKQAAEVEAGTIVLCGVSFMGESAKVLNEKKTVLLPDALADCPMAHMAGAEQIRKVREAYPSAAVVCYVNSTAELKRNADVCVTSANALKIVKALPNPVIYFIPDEHLGRFIAAQVPEKKFLFNEGFCPVHKAITAKDVRRTMEMHPNAQVLVHPECPEEVTALADYTGSTSGIIHYACECPAEEFIICTELGVMYELERRNPQKRFYAVRERQICEGMKRITLDKIIRALETGETEVKMEENLLREASVPLERMLQLAK